MRIVVHGQKAFGKALLERLLERGENVVAVCGAPTEPDEAEDPLVAYTSLTYTRGGKLETEDR